MAVPNPKTDKSSESEQCQFYLKSGTRLELSEALFQLSMMFWTFQNQTGQIESLAIIHFIAIIGVHAKFLAFRDAHHSTSSLSALTWIGRPFFLEYSLPLYSYNTLTYRWPARGSYRSQPSHLEIVRQKYMLRGCHSPLSKLIELKAFGNSIIRREGPPGNLTWAADGRSFTFKDKTIHLSALYGTFQNAI